MDLNIGDKVIVSGDRFRLSFFDKNISKAGLIGTICGTDMGVCCVEFDFDELVRKDPNVEDTGNNKFGVWKCDGRFNNNRGRYIREADLKLAYTLPDIRPNIDFIKGVIG